MYFLFPNFLFLTQTNMQKLKEYFAVRAVRLGVLAVLVATFVGLPSLKYYTGTHAFDKLDVVNMAASVFLAHYMPPADGGYMPPADGGYMPPADGGSYSTGTQGCTNGQFYCQSLGACADG